MTGTINASIFGSYTPSSGDSFADVIQFGSVSGDFTTKNLFLGNALTLLEQYNASSLTLTINHANLRFQASVANTTAGQPIVLQVAIIDSNGNVITSDNSDVVTLTLNQGTLLGNAQATMANGVASFTATNDLNIEAANTGYGFTASVPGLGNVGSNTFAILPGPVAEVTVPTTVSNNVVGGTLNALTVNLEDQFNNLETGDTSSQVTLALSPNANALQGGSAQTVSGGTVTFSGLSINLAANGYSITASSDGFTSQPTNTFTVGQPPAITSANAATFTVGQAGTPFIITTTGFPAPALSESGVLPANVTFTDNGTGTATITGTPAANTGGAYGITIKASDGFGNNATQGFTLDVDQAPAIVTNPQTQTAFKGAPVYLTATANGFPAPTVQWQASTDNGMTYNPIQGATSTTLSFTATQADNGNEYEAVFTNGTGTVTSNEATLTVQLAPDLTIAMGSLAVSPSAPQSGGQVTVAWNDQNIGASAVYAPFYDYILVQSVAANHSLSYVTQGAVNGDSTLAAAPPARCRPSTSLCPTGRRAWAISWSR